MPAPNSLETRKKIPMPQSKTNKTMHRQRERGNVFLFILLGIVLFAALSFTMSRGMRSEGTERINDRRADLAATEVLTFVQRVERGVNRLRRNGVSENGISFDLPSTANYDHGQPDSNKVFHAAGGSISFAAPPENANDGTIWLFTGETCIPDIGSGAAGCGSDTVSNEELLMVLPNVDVAVCEEINSRLNITGIPAETDNDAPSTAEYVGAFADGIEINLLGGPFNSACFSDGTNNYFYKVLIAR